MIMIDTPATFVDLMKTDYGWFRCASWCGREVDTRGNFCGHCSWMDLFICLDLEVEPSRGWYAAFDLLKTEIRGYRGQEIKYHMDPA